MVGFVGATDAKRTWVEYKVDSWVEGFIHLAVFAHISPHTVYYGLTISLQHECQFLQHIILGIGSLFALLEE